MNRLHLPNFNLELTLLGGQSFAWDKVGESKYIGVTQDRLIIIEHHDKYIDWQIYPERSDDEAWLRRYLRLDCPYDEILAEIGKDKYIAAAIDKYPGLRLLHQDFEDTVIGFLCSPTKSILGIRQCIRLMSRQYGKRVELGGDSHYLFPSVEALAATTPDQLRLCKVGFRAPNIIAAAKWILEHQIADTIPHLSTPDALASLKSNRGIGDKVADCILVYGLARDEITPFDVWGKRFMQQYYDFPTNAKYDQMRTWVGQQWGDKASWAGQFLFEYIREFEPGRYVGKD